jgi:transposase
MRKPIQLSPLNPAQIEELHALYRTTKDVRLRTRAHIILLAAEQGRSAPTIAQTVGEHDQTVRHWLKRYRAEGLEGLHEAPRLGAPKNVTPVYVTPQLNLVRRRPRSLGWPDSLWTLARLADDLAEHTGIRVEAETVRRHLQEADMVLSRPPHKISCPDPEYRVKKRRLTRPSMA